MFEPVCRSSDIEDNSSQAFTVNQRDVLIVRTGQDFYALENRCSHQAAPLHGGRIRRGMIACPLHGVMFELKTGKPHGRLTQLCVETFELEVRDEVIYVAIPEEDTWGV